MKQVMARQENCGKDFNLRKEGERCRHQEHGKGSCAQQLGEAAWREREGHGAVAWMGNTKTAALDQGSRVR